MCLSDFIAPKESGIPDYVGAFAVTCGLGCDELCDKFKANMDDYNIIMVKVRQLCGCCCCVSQRLGSCRPTRRGLC